MTKLADSNVTMPSDLDIGNVRTSTTSRQTQRFAFQLRFHHVTQTLAAQSADELECAAPHCSAYCHTADTTAVTAIVDGLISYSLGVADTTWSHCRIALSVPIKYDAKPLLTYPFQAALAELI